MASRNKKVSRARKTSVLPSKYKAKSWGPLSVLLIALGAVLVLFFWFQTRAAGSATLSLSPASPTVVTGQNVSFDIRMNSPVGVDGAEIYLSYPATHLQFVSTSTSGSAFPIDVVNSGGSGSITVIRYSTSLVSGNVFIARVTFKALASTGSANVTFGANTELTHADPDNPTQFINEAGVMNGATVTFTTQSSTPPPSPPPATPNPPTNPTPPSGSPSPAPTSPRPSAGGGSNQPGSSDDSGEDQQGNSDDAGDDSSGGGNTDDVNDELNSLNELDKISGVIKVKSKTADANTERVELLVNGRLVTTMKKAPFETDLDTTTFANGAYTITLRTVNADDSTTVSSREVTIDNKLSAFETVRNSILKPWAGTSGRVLNAIISVPALGVLAVGAVLAIRRFKPISF